MRNIKYFNIVDENLSFSMTIFDMILEKLIHCLVRKLIITSVNILIKNNFSRNFQFQQNIRVSIYIETNVPIIKVVVNSIILIKKFHTTII